MKRIKKFFGLLLIAAITMQIVAFNPVNAMAAEATPYGNVPQSASLQNNYADKEVLIGAVEISDTDITPYYTYYYLINHSGIYTSDISIPFTAVNNYVANVKLVVNFYYHDGHTGNVKVQCAGYSYTAAVDGESHVLDNDITLYPSNHTLTITGVDGTMTAVVYLYAVFS